MNHDDLKDWFLDAAPLADREEGSLTQARIWHLQEETATSRFVIELRILRGAPPPGTQNGYLNCVFASCWILFLFRLSGPATWHSTELRKACKDVPATFYLNNFQLDSSPRNFACGLWTRAFFNQGENTFSGGSSNMYLFINKMRVTWINFTLFSPSLTQHKYSSPKKTTSKL